MVKCKNSYILLTRHIFYMVEPQLRDKDLVDAKLNKNLREPLTKRIESVLFSAEKHYQVTRESLFDNIETEISKNHRHEINSAIRNLNEDIVAYDKLIGNNKQP